MNLHFKNQIATQAFEIYNNGESLPEIVELIEALMIENGLKFTTQNVTSTITKANGETVVMSARDRFEEALDSEEILNPQHMKLILEDHINFLNAFILRNKQAA